jgi:hypothetical protein
MFYISTPTLQVVSPSPLAARLSKGPVRLQQILDALLPVSTTPWTATSVLPDHTVSYPLPPLQHVRLTLFTAFALEQTVTLNGTEVTVYGAKLIEIKCTPHSEDDLPYTQCKGNAIVRVDKAGDEIID